MKEVDYIIVGFGIAGLCFAETLRNQNKSYVVIADFKDGATAASGGVLNPTVLKRFTAAWRAAEFKEFASPFYKEIGDYLGEAIIATVKIKRILNSIEEQNDWMLASDKRELSQFLSPKLEENSANSINAPYKLGVVNGGNLLNPQHLLKEYRAKLLQEEKVQNSTFDYSQLQPNTDFVRYQSLKAKYIIFAEGTKVLNNPFFPYSEPRTSKSVLVGNKGDYVLIKAPELAIKDVLKGGMMLIPLGDDIYKVGATYSRHEYTSIPSIEKREEILEKLAKMIATPFEVVDQVCGVRPTIKDRRPLLGSLKNNRRIAFLNGLGTRGLSMAPLAAQWLYNHLEQNAAIPEEVTLNRFLK